MTDEIMVNLDNDVESLSKLNEKINKKVTDKLKNSIQNINNTTADFDRLKFDTVKNKLFLKYLGIDYEGLFQDLNKNNRII